MVYSDIQLLLQEMQKKCDALRKEYDEIRAELAPYYPELREENTFIINQDDTVKRD